jgi:hypothetical protein
MQVIGKSIPVEIEVNQTNIKFDFSDNEYEMTTSETITLFNNGNSDAFFKFTLGK